MKKILTVLFLLALAAAPARAMGEPTFTTGRDWMQKMTPGEKFMSVALPMAMLHEYGVPVRLTPEQYIPIIDRILRFNPQFVSEDVANIFTSTVYAVEPGTRPSLLALEEQFLRGDFRPDLVSPSLSLSETIE
ncbi:MAG TPA: hypothetical protein VL404_01590 [Candidatus Eisenbacteria bacterium]|jgi:hypothetical protein|nr:hypothetical protein [Candidatus Eisenbacteria bacterium]